MSNSVCVLSSQYTDLTQMQLGSNLHLINYQSSMPTNPNKLTHLWGELKRRKVARVITVYAAAAFVILELVDIVSPSLRLPEWTMNFIIVLLCVGFIITVIVSWVYDVTPEGGIVKTEPAYKVDKSAALTTLSRNMMYYINLRTPGHLPGQSESAKGGQVVRFFQIGRIFLPQCIRNAIL